MKKLLVLLCAMFVLVGMSVAQTGTAAKSSTKASAKKSAGMGKATTMAGKISDGGKTFTDAKGTAYSISNADDDKSLKASDIAKHDGHDVKLNGHYDATAKTVHVVKITMAPAAGAKAGTKKSKKAAAPPSN